MSPPGGLSMAWCLLLLLHLLFVSSPPAAASPSLALRVAAAPCNGSIAECASAEEFLMDSEIHRRMLQGGGGGSIGYRAINAGGRPVCNSGGGQQYTGNCVPERSNPRTRPCSRYYRCDRDTGGGQS